MGRLLLLPFYWLTVVLIRAAGTAVGDFISGRNMLGLPVSTAVTGASRGGEGRGRAAGAGGRCTARSIHGR